MFQKIDDWLFDKIFQPFADWFYDAYGKNTFWIAATLCYSYILTVACERLIAQEISFDYNVLDIVLCIYIASKALKNDAKARRIRRTQRNAARIIHSYFVLRQVIFLSIIPAGILLLFSVSIVGSVLIFLRVIIFCMIFYFEACDTKPPASPKKGPQTRLAYAN
jgi:hypothetical protein